MQSLWGRQNEGTFSLPKPYCTQTLHFISTFFIHHAQHLGIWHFETTSIQLAEDDPCYCYFFIYETTELLEYHSVTFKTLTKTKPALKTTYPLFSRNYLPSRAYWCLHRKHWENNSNNTPVSCSDKKKPPKWLYIKTGLLDMDQNWMIKG